MGSQMVTDIMLIYQNYQTGSFNLTQVVMPMAQSLFMWTQYCTFDDATYDLIVWCESNDCTWQNLFQNLLKTVF